GGARHARGSRGRLRAYPQSSGQAVVPAQHAPGRPDDGARTRRGAGRVLVLMTVAKLRVKSPSKEPVGYHRESSRLILGPQPIVLLACVAAVSVVSAGAAGPPAHDNGAANGGIPGPGGPRPRAGPG